MFKINILWYKIIYTKTELYNFADGGKRHEKVLFGP